MDSSTRDGIYERVRSAVIEHQEQTGRGRFGHCFWYAYYGITELRKAGIDACVQAGTAYWQRLPNDKRDDDNAAFGFQWDPRSMASMLSMMQYGLPEVHVWLGVVKTQELIDFSTGDLPSVCKTLLGLDWHHTLPPAYYWGRATDIPDEAYYKPISEACVWVGRQFDHYGLDLDALHRAFNIRSCSC